MGKFKVGQKVRSTSKLFGPDVLQAGVVRGFYNEASAVVEYHGWNGGHDGIGGGYRGPDLARSAHWIPIDDLVLDQAAVDDDWDYDPRKAGNDNAFKIEAGKFYRRRDGQRVGPVTPCRVSDDLIWESEDCYYDAIGRAKHLEEERDLVAEWVDAQPKPASTPHIVAVFINGHPAPNERPFVHGNAEAATDEAERLASLHPSQEFGVFALVTKRIGEVTVRAA